jgi:CheY-like chemotaxis protein
MVRPEQRVVATEPLILVVEDNPIAREALKRFLEADGYRVHCAQNGREALESVQAAELPCLILLDLTMPVMDGWQFRQLQKESPLFAHIPVVLVSSDVNLAQVAAALGAAGYCPKPVEFRGLRETIRVLGKTCTLVL